MDKPGFWEMKKSRLSYRLSRLRQRWRVMTFRCPACPKRPRGPHKFGCSLYGKQQVVLYMRER